MTKFLNKWRFPQRNQAWQSFGLRNKKKRVHSVSRVMLLSTFVWMLATVGADSWMVMLLACIFASLRSVFSASAKFSFFWGGGGDV